jgi:hypothetical protein
MCKDNVKITWIDRGMEPKCQPDPSYPTGVDADVSGGSKRTCKINLPYPAKRCGVYLVKCKLCGSSVALTTAGRADDPRSVTIACKIEGKTQ